MDEFAEQRHAQVEVRTGDGHGSDLHRRHRMQPIRIDPRDAIGAVRRQRNAGVAINRAKGRLERFQIEFSRNNACRPWGRAQDASAPKGSALLVSS